MINVVDKADCCGCNACGDVCCNGAISFERDIGGFLYPRVDAGKCTGCGACDRVCPMPAAEGLRKAVRREIPENYAAVSKDLAVRFDSTSGGLFSVLAEYVFRKGGFVGGAVWEDGFFVRQVVTDDQSDLPRLRSSKYAQSDARGFYRAVRDALTSGRKVLVCGLPCQMAAVRSFLGKDFDNLIVIDLICRTCSSPEFLRQYIKYQEDMVGARVIAIKQKDKGLGWRNLTTKLSFDNGQIIYDPKSESYFMRTFEANLISRPSCYACKFKGFPRVADITLADCWGAVEKIPEELNLDNNIGTSLVMCNTGKGTSVFDEVKKDGRINFTSVKFEDVLKGNFGLRYSVPRPAIDPRTLYDGLGKVSLPLLMDPILCSCERRRRNGSLRTFLRRVRNVLRHRWNIFRVIKYNGLIRTLRGDCLIIPHGPLVVEKTGSAKIIVKATTVLGASLFKRSNLESRYRLYEGSELILEGGTIGHGCHVVVFKGGHLDLGKRTCVNIGLTISCAQSIKFGSDVFIGQNVTIRDTHGDHYINTPDYCPTKPVVIGDHVWICSNAVIMPGVKVGSGSIVAACSLVNKDVPPGTIVAGVPARVIRTGVQFRC